MESLVKKEKENSKRGWEGIVNLAPKYIQKGEPEMRVR